MERKEKAKCELRTHSGRRLGAGQARRGGTCVHVGGRGLCRSNVVKYRSPGVRRICRTPCHASVLRPHVDGANLPHDLARFRHFPEGGRLPSEVAGDTRPTSLLTVLRLPRYSVLQPLDPREWNTSATLVTRVALGAGRFRSFRPRSLDRQRVAGSGPALRACWSCELGWSTCLLEPQRHRF